MNTTTTTTPNRVVFHRATPAPAEPAPEPVFTVEAWPVPRGGSGAEVVLRLAVPAEVAADALVRSTADRLRSWLTDEGPTASRPGTG